MKTHILLLCSAMALNQAAVTARADENEAQTRALNMTRCVGSDVDVSIAGCSALILSGRETGATLAAVYQRRGAAYYNKKSFDLAVTDLTTVITLKPSFAGAYYDRGEAYLAGGLFGQAIADYNQAIALKPRYAEAYSDRGVAYGDEGQVDQAIADETQAITLQPDLAEAYCDRGLAYKKKGLIDQAITDYTRAIALQPDYGRAYYNRGLAKQAKGDLAGGDADIAWARQNDPHSVTEDSAAASPPASVTP